jgi:hypothetical protein
MGRDDRIHVGWSDNLDSPWNVYNGIYYARLNPEGVIEKPATRVIGHNNPLDAHLFMDSEGNLNVVWVAAYDTLYYSKFDTTGQVLIPKTPVYIPGGNTYIWYLNACMDSQDQIHCVFKNYWGVWFEFNLGYSRVNNQGEVLHSYYPLTPESTSSFCGYAHIVADQMDNLHLLYLLGENGQQNQYYRKLDQDLNTIFDILLGEYSFISEQAGTGDITLDGNGDIVLAWRDNQPGGIDMYTRATYSPEGEVVISNEVIIDGENMNWPGLAVHPDGMAVFNIFQDVTPINESGIYYCYTVDDLAINTGQIMYSPQGFEIFAYPNPFNPVTTLSYNLPEKSKVSLKVYHLHGQLVAKLVDGWRDKGLHEVTFDASHLASGMYFYNLTSGTYSTTRKMILIK